MKQSARSKSAFRSKGGPDLQAKYLGLVEQLPKEIRKEYRERTIELWAKVDGERKPQKFERREFSDEQIARWQAERASLFLPNSRWLRTIRK
jgi:hypothetical protein